VPASRTSVDHALRTAFAYLSETDALEAEPYDAVIGFGTFDLSLPRFCGDLRERGYARRIIFTGGVGAGTGDLGGPEADVWLAALARSHPAIDIDHVIVENRSTNTGENVRFTGDLLRAAHPALALGVGVRRVIVVTAPSRLRRVGLTMRRQHPGVHVTRQLPSVTMTADAALYARQGIDYRGHLAGELDRIVAYPERGWIVSEPLPTAVESARRVLWDR
jgi:uncharacterized SAM-binding protein YcdF (DUF218 family)